MTRILKCILTFFIGLAASSSCWAVFTPAMTPTIQDPCARNFERSPLLHKASLPLKKRYADAQTLSHQQRMQVVCSLEETVEKIYGPYFVRERSAQVSPQKQLRQCVLDELRHTENNNLTFYDRLEKCIAGLKDGHFVLGLSSYKPDVFTGVFITQTSEGKYVIRRTYSKVMSYLNRHNKDLEENLQPGHEITHVDGLPIEEAIAQLLPYVSGSSPESRQTKAIYRLTYRDFKYPESKFLNLKMRKTVQDGDPKTYTVRIPWWYTNRSGPEFAYYLEQLGIQNAEKFFLDYSADENKWSTTEDLKLNGFWLGTPLVKEKYLTTYYRKDNRVALRLGEGIFKGPKPFCYVQNKSFRSKIFETRAKKESNDGRSALDYMQVLAEFVKNCEDKQLPMIMDLRQNSGGYAYLPGRLYSLLTSDDLHENKVTPFFAYRVSDYTKHLLSNYMSFDGNDGAELFWDDSGISWEQQYDAFIDSYLNGDDYTPALARHKFDKLNPDDKRMPDYTQKIVLLTTPSCISACDNFAARMQQEGRATVVGTPTEGTGEGFRGSGKVGPISRDIGQYLRLRVPNYIYGYMPSEKYTDGMAFEEYARYVTTNKPVQPDIRYVTELAEIKGEKQGWLEKAISVLYSENDKKAPGNKQKPLSPADLNTIY